LVSALKIFLGAYLAITLMCGLTGVLKWSWHRLPNKSWRDLRVIALAMTALFPFLPLMTHVSMAPEWTLPVAQVWSSSEKDNQNSPTLAAIATTSVSWVEQRQSGLLVVEGALVILALASLGGVVGFVRQRNRLRRVLRSAVLARKFRSMKLLYCDGIASAFSCRMDGLHYVVLPQSYLQDLNHARIAIRHELQHIRHGDTEWAQAILFIKQCLWLHPAAHRWATLLEEIQELACDEAMLCRARQSFQEYVHCLLWATDIGGGRSFIPVGTTGMAKATSPHQLTRRVRSMKDAKKRSRMNGKICGMLGAAICALMISTTTWAVQSVQDRRLSLDDAKTLAAKVEQQSPDFAIEVNDHVLTQLNRLLATPEGRDHLQKSKLNMKQHQQLVDDAIAKFKLPKALAAVPLVESGYQNLPSSPRKSVGAGIWMFIKPTAKAWGLRVDEQTDERLDVAKETEAAMKLLQSEYESFKSWPLALMAYNMGGAALRQAIERVGSRDPWLIIEAGHENDKGYLAKVMAAVIALSNPET